MSDIIRDMTEITRCGVQYRTEKLAPMGLKACHASYLTEICAQPGISQDTLSQRICINKSNVARQVVILEEGGFIRRESCCADKRVMKLYPTDKALELMPQIQKIMADWEDFLTASFSADECAQLEAALVSMKEKAASWMEAH